MTLTGPDQKPVLRAATVGCGRMGAFHSEAVSKHAPAFWMPISHLAAIDAIQGAKAVACCDVIEKNAVRAQMAFNIPNIYLDAIQMLEREDLDLVTLATRTPQKTSVILAAIASGVRALHVEKPLCNTASELETLRKKIIETNTLVTYGCIRRYLPPYERAKNHINSIAFGSLEDIHIEMGAASLLWSLVHGLDLLLYFASPAKPVLAQAWFENVIMADNNENLIKNDPKILSATILFDNGLTGRIGRTSGDAVTLSSAISRLEIISDGRQVFSSVIPKGRIYQHRKSLNWLSDTVDDGLGGTAKPLDLLHKGLNGDASALSIIKNTMNDMFESQSLVFDLLHSHFKGGRPVETGSYPTNIGILGITDGNPA